MYHGAKKIGSLSERRAEESREQYIRCSKVLSWFRKLIMIWIIIFGWLLITSVSLNSIVIWIIFGNKGRVKKWKNKVEFSTSIFIYFFVPYGLKIILRHLKVFSFIGGLKSAQKMVSMWKNLSDFRAQKYENRSKLYFGEFGIYRSDDVHLQLCSEHDLHDI